MNPHQKNKIDISSLNSDEQRLFRMYGKLPNKKDLLQNKLKERKYFDSGDYALSKAGKAGDSGVTSIGTEHPNADTIPHASPLTHIVTRDSVTAASPPSQSPAQTMNNLSAEPPSLGGQMHRGSINGIPGGHNLPTGSISIVNSRSPVKESYLNRSASIDDPEGETEKDQQDQMGEDEISPPPKVEGMPIRRS